MLMAVFDAYYFLYIQIYLDLLETGPHIDSTTTSSEGWYIYVESSYPSRPGNKATLVSESLRPTDQSCFSLFYFM